MHCQSPECGDSLKDSLGMHALASCVSLSLIKLGLKLPNIQHWVIQHIRVGTHIHTHTQLQDMPDDEAKRYCADIKAQRYVDYLRI